MAETNRNVTSKEDVVSTNTGILFFGRDPQMHVILSEVVCVLFRETIGASRYADHKIVTGTLQELIDGAEAFLCKYFKDHLNARTGETNQLAPSFLADPATSLEKIQNRIKMYEINQFYELW
jgi:predicted HTH transcriptional regulator